MNLLEFISPIIEATVWPLSILSIVLLSRKTINERLKNLEKISYKDLEMEFRQKMSELEAKISLIDIPEEVTLHLVKQDKKEQDFITVAEVSPRAAIVVAWAMIEKQLTSTLLKLDIATQSPPVSPVQKISLLKNQQHMNQITEKAILDLIELKNMAEHAQPNKTGITEWDALKYYEISVKMIRILREL